MNLAMQTPSLQHLLFLGFLMPRIIAEPRNRSASWFLFCCVVFSLSYGYVDYLSGINQIWIRNLRVGVQDFLYGYIKADCDDIQRFSRPDGILYDAGPGITYHAQRGPCRGICLARDRYAFLDAALELHQRITGLGSENSVYRARVKTRDLEQGLKTDHIIAPRPLRQQRAYPGRSFRLPGYDQDLSGINYIRIGYLRVQLQQVLRGDAESLGDRPKGIARLNGCGLYDTSLK